MPGNFRKDDLRIVKTYKALNKSLTELLSQRNFDRITVNDLCEEAQLSRTAFYQHFNDKYDLLRYWLHCLRNDIRSGSNDYEGIEMKINQFIYNNQKIITNLFTANNNEVRDLIGEFLISLIDLKGKNHKNAPRDLKYIVLASFCAGGIFDYILWQVKNNFPEDIKVINIFFYEMIQKLNTMNQD